jgi:hypothetical protein
VVQDTSIFFGELAFFRSAAQSLAQSQFAFFLRSAAQSSAQSQSLSQFAFFLRSAAKSSAQSQSQFARFLRSAAQSSAQSQSQFVIFLARRSAKPGLVAVRTCLAQRSAELGSVAVAVAVRAFLSHRSVAQSLAWSQSQSQFELFLRSATQGSAQLGGLTGRGRARRAAATAPAGTGGCTRRATQVKSS